MDNRRVVVTGTGAITPLGRSVKETWAAAKEGTPGIGRISLFDATDAPIQIAGEVKNFDPLFERGPFRPRADETEITQALSKKDLKKMGRFIHLALNAGLEAYEDSGLDSSRSKIDPTRIGINIGAGMGGLPEIEGGLHGLIDKGYRRISPFFIPQVIANMASGHLSILLNLKGPNLCNVTACSTSAHSIGESFHIIKRGDADVMFAGGTEGTVSPLGIGGFASMKALSTQNDEPEKASRPFDADRDGFVMGEGTAVFVLEEYEHAKKRGAEILGEIVGYGLSGDAYHMTTPSPGGEGGYRAMEMALKHAKLRPDQIAYVNAHATSTPAGDTEEAQAIARLFTDGPAHLHVSATKSMTGHLLGAAGAVESLFCLLAIRDGVIPPTINLDHLDPTCAELKLDFTANQAAEKKVDYALSNSFGFGGTNACLIVAKAP